ncbi:uncharacterized protein TNCV_173501 [Trichonephila clavipes]|nr:uncharacterized protein TNCV_173501 [Trichonephila clavipes]
MGYHHGVFEKKRLRKVRQFFDDFNADEKLQDRERLFEEDVFKANVDITTQLKNRYESINGIYKSFSFLSPKNIVSTTNDLLYNEASNLQKVYSLDLSSEFPNQIMSLKAVFSEDLIKLNSIKDLVQWSAKCGSGAVCGSFAPQVRLRSRMWLFCSSGAALAQISTEGEIIRSFKKKLGSKEELLGLLPLKGQTRGEDIANAVKLSVWIIIFPSIKLCRFQQMGPKKRFVRKHFRMKFVVMELEITIINSILAKALNHRQFKEFLFEMKSEYADLLHNKVRWLSRALKRFASLFPKIKAFLLEKGVHYPELTDDQ